MDQSQTRSEATRGVQRKFTRGHARLVGCARNAEKGNDAYVSIHELTKNGKTYLVGNRLLSSLLARARISRAEQQTRSALYFNYIISARMCQNSKCVYD